MTDNGHSERSVVAGIRGEEGINRKFLGSDTIRYDTIMVVTCHCSSKPIECTIPGMNSNVNYGLWIIMTCQCGFIHCNKCTIVAGDIDSQGECECGESAGGTWEHILLFAQFCCKPKIALKIKAI